MPKGGQLAKHLIIIFLFISLNSKTIDIELDQMSAPEIYERCYAKLLNKPVPQDNSVLIGLSSKPIQDAENACENLLNLAEFDSTTDQIQNKNGEEAKEILKTFQLLHNSWFSSKVILDDSPIQKLLYDVDEPANYWTRALFRPNTRVDSVLLYNKSLKSIRSRPDLLTKSHYQVRTFFSYPNNIIGVTRSDLDILLRVSFIKDMSLVKIKDATIDGRNYDYIDVPNENISQFGDLIGITDQPPLIIPRLLFPLSNNSKIDINLLNPLGGFNYNIDIHKHDGGGILGSNVYAFKNSNLNRGSKAKGYDIIDRRFASRVFEDLLCYQLPILSPQDVIVYPNSIYPFQRNRSCMQCHATIDEFAMMQRNYIFISNSSFTGSFLKPTSTPIPMAQDPSPIGAQFFARQKLPSDPSSTDFAFSPPAGTLDFRTFSGSRVRANITSFEDVGKILSQQDDFYTCTAKKYYKYFTGIDVQLGSIAKTPLEQQHLDFVSKLGNELKNSSQQSTKELIVKIFKSKAFQSRNYKTEENSP